LQKKTSFTLSRAENGICHIIHLEHFGFPDKTLLGSDSHTSINGALGMLAIGVGELDVAIALAGEPIYIKMPWVVNVKLKGKLMGGVSAKDVLLL